MAKIFFIDDDPDIRDLMKATLERQGFDVVTAGSREEALQKLETAQPSVILMDVLLSGADGRELCREIKSARATAHIPVIIISGHPSAMNGIESYGADDFLAKPFSNEALLAKLSRQLKLA